MIKHTLVCLLKNDKNASFKTLKASSNPSIEKIREVYFKNVEVLQYILDYCHKNNIISLRVSSSLFPLATYAPYRDRLLPLLDEVGKEYKKLNYYGIELSSHPDQFILLSSVNDNINANSRYDLEVYAHMKQYIPWNLVNIHVGSKINGFIEHSKIIKKQIALLSADAQKILSLENDEKSYCFKETLLIAQENNVMIVPDFHHERCFQKRNNFENKNLSDLSLEENILWNDKIDNIIYDNLDAVFDTYKNKDASPTFHISSPINGWNGIFKEHCMHADYISLNDYPILLNKLAKDKTITCRLDIEAKFKNEAIKLLNEQLKIK